MAVNTDLPPGTAEVRYVASESEPGKEYRMIRTRGGWQHADAGCPAWGWRGVCRHVNDLNNEPTGPGAEVVPISSDPLAVVEELEDTAIIEAVQGKVSPTWVYSFPQGGATVTGLSVVGVEQAAREMAQRGEALRIIDCHIEYEDDREARFVAVAGRYAVSGDGKQVLLDSTMRAKRQPKFMKLRNGTEKPDPHWYEKGMSKATRNAKAALLSDEVRQFIIAEATKAGPERQRVRTVAQDTPASAPERGEAVVPKAQPAQPAQPAESANGNAQPGDIGKLRHDAGKALERFQAAHGDDAWRAFMDAYCPGAYDAETGNVRLANITAEQAERVLKEAAKAPVAPAAPAEPEGQKTLAQ